MASRIFSSASLALLLALGALAPSAVLAATLPLEIEHLAIEMDPLDARVVFEKDKNDTSYFPVTVISRDGKRMTGRIATKGGFSQGFEKRPLKIKLDKPYELDGQSTLALNSMGVDRSAMREFLAWDLIHSLGMVAPPVGYTFLTVNGDDRGLFFRLGWIDGKMFDRYGYGDRGEFFDPVDAISCADLSLNSVRNPPVCWDKIFPGDGNYDSLKALVLGIDREPVETFHQFAERHLHLDSVINWIVVTAITSNTQTYNDEYFLFRSEKTGKWLLIPWSYDRSFGWNYEFSVPEPAASDNDNFQYYYPLELGALNPLRDKLFNNPVTRKLIEDRLAEIVIGSGPKKPWSGWFTPEHMNTLIDEVLEARAPYLARDPFIGPDIPNIHEKVEALRHYAEARHHYFRTVTLGDTDWVRDRARARVPRSGGHVVLTDGWGFQLASLDAERGSSAEIDVQIRRGRPELAPRDVNRRACVRRTWVVRTSSPVEGKLEIEYLEENRRLSEIGRRVSDESRLNLFVRDDDGWRELQAELNTLSNVFSADVSLRPGRQYWIVACEVPAQQTASR